MTHTAKEPPVASLADVVDLPLKAPVLPAAVLRFARQLAQRLLPWAVPVGLIALWQVASSQGWLSTRVLPAPLDVIKAAWALAASGELWTHVRVSAGRALTGLAIGGGLGLLHGLGAGREVGAPDVVPVLCRELLFGHAARRAAYGADTGAFVEGAWAAELNDADCHGENLRGEHSEPWQTRSAGICPLPSWLP